VAVGLVLTGSGPVSPDAAPQTASVSAFIRAVMTVVSIERSRSGKAEAR